MSADLPPGVRVRSGQFHGVVVDPAEAVMPAPLDGRNVRVRWEFDGNPSYSVTWERPDALTVSADLRKDSP